MGTAASPPFLMIDRVEEVEPGVRAVAVKCVTVNEPQLGSFSGKLPLCLACSFAKHLRDG